jgi:predicted O-linked N-acetylglucosamine transferase (SPINDLY family)
MGDLMLDPYPFGGGVTTLEALAVCTPVITAPGMQSVPTLAAGMIQSVGLPRDTESWLIVDDSSVYIRNAIQLLEDGILIRNVRRDICKGVKHIYNQDSSVKEWQQFLVAVATGLLS